MSGRGDTHGESINKGRGMRNIKFSPRFHGNYNTVFGRGKKKLTIQNKGIFIYN